MSEARSQLGPNQAEEKPLTPEQQQFVQLLEKYGHSFNRGDVVPGVVSGYEGSGVLVDIGAKTLAYMPPKEVSIPPPENLEEAVPVGEKLDVFILREDDKQEQFVVSKRRVAQARTWDELDIDLGNEAIIDCVITQAVKGGLLVDVKGLRGFVPSSHLRVRESFDDLIGKEIPLKILSLDQQNNNIILSHKKVVADQLAEQRKGLFETLEEGMVVEGEVVRLTDFGAFVDLGGVDGLLPLSQMSWRWVEHPSDLHKVGDKVKVEIISIDRERQRVSLSVKSQTEDPWVAVANEYHEGLQVEGKVTRLKHFGAFVEIYPGVEALLPSKEIADFERENSDQKIDSGNKIVVAISKFSPDERRISLSFDGVEQDFASDEPDEIEEQDTSEGAEDSVEASL